MFGFGSIRNKIASLWSGLGSRLKSLFSSQSGEIDYDKLEKLLLESDVGVKVCDQLIESVKAAAREKGHADLETVQKELGHQLLEILQNCPTTTARPKVLLIVGVNGAGKTTFAAKLAGRFKAEGKKPLMVAADTFRAAAGDQIFGWADKAKIDLVEGVDGQDPASVVYQGATKFIDEGFDSLIIDTAGRLHTKQNLMTELEKIKKVLSKKLGENQEVSTWLVLDSMLGQSSISQAEIFNASTKLDGIVLTKCDGAAKGGGIFAIAKQFNIPIVFTASGQKLEDLEEFDASEYVNKFLS